MFIQTIVTGPFDTNCYIATCPQTKRSAIIDPGVESLEKIEPLLHDTTLDKILITHSHWDHIGDVAAFKQKFALPIFIHPLDAPNLEKPGSDALPCWLTIEGATADVLIDEKTIITVGDLTFSVIHTPGHSPGSVCFYCEKEHVLFSGDTLFQGSIGNLSFPTAQPDLMWPSLDKLAKLPKETAVYPGHGSQTTIGQEAWLPKAKDFFG